MTLGEARSLVMSTLHAARAEGRRSFVVITGRSGAIRREFLFWVDENPSLRSVETLNGGGAFRLHLFRNKSRNGV
jgi:hypothetical protein